MARQPIGFLHQHASLPAPRTEFVELEAGCLTIAPTGAGKSTGLVVPWSVLHDGPLVVIDPKGEVASTTAAYRRRHGNNVAVLDPFGQTVGQPHFASEPLQKARINPLELIIEASECEAADLARGVANTMCPPSLGKEDPFWDNAARGFLTSLLLFVARYAPPKDRHLGTVHEIVMSNTEGLAVVLAAMSRCNTNSYGGCIAAGASVIASAPDRTRESILTTLRVALSWLSSPPVLAHFRRATLSLRAISDGRVGGRPLTLYLVLPLHYMESHAPLIRLWCDVVVQAIFRRKAIPNRPTLFIADEAAALGALPSLRSAFTQMRGFGLIPALIYQDPTQLKGAWPHEWPLFRANTDVIQVFGARHAASAGELADFVGWTGSLLELASNEQIVSTRKNGLQRLKRLSSVHDAWLAAKTSPNPYYQAQGRR